MTNTEMRSTLEIPKELLNGFVMGGDIALKANSSEALICASPRKIFTSVNMLPSEAKPN